MTEAKANKLLINCIIIIMSKSIKCGNVIHITQHYNNCPYKHLSSMAATPNTQATGLL